MAGADNDNEDRTEEATPERRDEFREEGQIALSKEITSVFVLAAVAGLFGSYLVILSDQIQTFMRHALRHLSISIFNEKSFLIYAEWVGKELLIMMLPSCAVAAITGAAITFGQTRLNWSWKRIAPNFKRMNPLSGLARLVSAEAAVEVLKSVGKMIIIGAVSYLILKSEIDRVPNLINVSFDQAWAYWADITHLLIWSVLGLLLFLAAGDFIYVFISLEKKLMMTKQEVKEEYRKRELDPHVKGKMKRMQREIANSKSIQATKGATVVITNPTHYAVALSYELGMQAPIVIAKGQDFTAQRMKEVAKENNIPIMENKPLARTLFKVCKVGQQIPESLYKAVSEIIRYVFLLKGKKLTRSST